MRVIRKGPLSICMLVLLSLCGIRGTPARSQTRVSDEDVETLMRNLKDDAKSFRLLFDSAVHKSTIRKTSQEKDAKNLVARFEKQTKAMLKTFEKTKKRDDVPGVLSTAYQIDKLVSDLKLDSQITSNWRNIRDELPQLSSAFGISGHDSRTVIPTVVHSNAPPCVQAVGAKQAARLVDECLQVSPATNPPCDVRNACVLIIDEIKRACAFLQRSAPEFCGPYK